MSIHLGCDERGLLVEATTELVPNATRDNHTEVSHSHYQHIGHSWQRRHELEWEYEPIQGTVAEATAARHLLAENEARNVSGERLTVI